MEKEIGIRFGILADPIYQQVTSQGFLISKKKAGEFEALKEAINLLYFADILKEDEKNSAQKRLFSNIKKAVRIPKK